VTPAPRIDAAIRLLDRFLNDASGVAIISNSSVFASGAQICMRAGSRPYTSGCKA
jgi:hypothetical protein